MDVFRYNKDNVNMGKAKTRPKVSKPHCSPAVNKAKSLKEKYGTGRLSPGKCLRARRALVDVQEKKSSIRKAAKVHSVSVSYLRRRLFGEVSVDSRNGPSPVFNKEEEEAMAKWLKEMAERGMGLKPGEFLDFVEQVIKKEKRKTPFTGDRPSYKWYHKFMERNKHIVEIRKETPLESSRAKLTRRGVDEWYTNFKQFLIEHGLLHKPERIYNADETGFNLSSKAGKVIGPARSNQNISVPHVSGGSSKQRITVMFCGCADGTMIPPYLVYPEPRPRGYSPLTGGITGSDIVFTKKGWMDSVAYESFLQHFDKYACKERPVVLLIDSVSSHISMGAFETAKKNGIHLYRIVPNATHLMQPLDKGVFGPLKQRWNQVTRSHARDNPGVAIGKETFSEKLKEAFLLFYKPLTVLNSFKVSGIYPVDSTKISDTDLKPGLTYTSGDIETEETAMVKETKSSQEELDAQGALRAFEKVLSTPARQRYQKRMEEGYDLVGQSPCYEVYKKLRHASEGSTQTATCSTASDVVSNSDETSGLDILASAALERHDNIRLDDSNDSQELDTTSAISPVLIEAMVLPKSTKAKAMRPKRLIDELPHNLTSDDSIRKMALRDIAKVRAFAEKERKAQMKYLASQKTGNYKRKKAVSCENKGKPPSSVVCEEINKDTTSESEQNENENVKCKGCDMSWKEDEELGLGRTWVFCESCKSWLHVDCCTQLIDLESDDPFCCPDCTK